MRSLWVCQSLSATLFFFNDTATTEIYTLSLHDALPISGVPLSLLASALIPVLWTYDGWADPATMAGGGSDPQRNLAPALIAGALWAMLVYLVGNIGFMYALAPAPMAGSPLIASHVAAPIPLPRRAG